jgi:hypothetical protein
MSRKEQKKFVDVKFTIAAEIISPKNTNGKNVKFMFKSVTTADRDMPKPLAIPPVRQG